MSHLIDADALYELSRMISSDLAALRGSTGCNHHDFSFSSHLRASLSLVLTSTIMATWDLIDIGTVLPGLHSPKQASLKVPSQITPTDSP